MKRSLVVYVIGVVVSAAALALTVAAVSEYPLLPGELRSWVGLLTLMLVTVIAESVGVLSLGGRAYWSVSLIPIAAIIPLFGPAVAILSTIISQSVVRFIIGQGLLKSLFNIGQLTLAVGLGSLSYVALGGSVSAQNFDLLSIVGPFGAMVAAYFLTNTASVSVVIRLDTGKRLSEIWREFGPMAFVNDIVSSSFSLFVVFAFTELGPVGLLIALLPLVFVQYSYGFYFTLQKQNKEILELLVKTIEARDPYTSGHSQRVAALAREVAEHLGLGGRKVEEIETAALLHDIGKIDVTYSEFLSSSSQLSKAELDVIRSHPERGAQLLESLSSLPKPVLDGVRHHHEHFDGNGYPSGLVGEGIPLPARVVMVSDTIDAMLSNRPYRGALRSEDVRTELRRFSGRQFDPQIVRLVLDSDLIHRAAVRAERDRTPLPRRGPKVSRKAAGSLTS